jgi:CRISPR/Cas system CMR-associated protein Cmr5 small subunit
MAICGLPKTRYNAFTKNEINLTAYYVYKFMEGLRMTADYIEKKSGRVLSEAQRKALRKVAWSNANDDIIAALMEDKALTKKVRSQIGKKNT